MAMTPRMCCMNCRWYDFGNGNGIPPSCKKYNRQLLYKTIIDIRDCCKFKWEKLTADDLVDLAVYNW